MKLDDRRMCDRCGEEIERGEYWFLLRHNGSQLCAHCLNHMRITREIPPDPVFTITTFRDNEDGGVSVFASGGGE